MSVRERGDLAADLLRGRNRFQAWRGQQPKRGRRIPRSLWRLAIRLAKTYGIHRTKAALRLDYYSLKKQVEAATGPARSSGPEFVELTAPVVVGTQCLFELDNGAGASMRVQVMGYAAADVAVLARSFWNAE
jgi:hypothetical protein